MKNKVFIKTAVLILTLALVPFSMVPFAADKDKVAYVTDPVTGVIYTNPPPRELLDARDANAQHNLLVKWNQTDSQIQKRIKDYFECENSLTGLKKKLKTLNDRKNEKLSQYNESKLNLKKMLLATVGRLGLQTTVVITDALTDLQLAVKKLKELKNTNVDMKKARMVGEFEALKEKAVQYRLQAIKKQLYIQSLEQAFRNYGKKQISEWKPQKKYFTKKMDDFWIETDKAAGFPQLNATERQKYKIDIKDGKVVGPDGKLLDTSNAIPMHPGSPSGRGIYVMDESGNIYVNTEPGYNFKHSSFLSGGQVAAAGEITIKDGKLIYIDPNSGHYLPKNPAWLDQVLNRLDEMGIDISGVETKRFP